MVTQTRLRAIWVVTGAVAALVGLLVLVLVVAGLIVGAILLHSGSKSAQRVSRPLTTTPSAFIPAPRSSSASLERLVADASHGKARIVQLRPGPGPLTTLVIRIHHQPLVILTDGHYLFLGPVFNARGHNVIKPLQRALIENTAPTPANLSPPTSGRAHASFPSAADTSFVVGRSGPTVTMVADPNCVFCHQMWESVLWPAIQSGRLRVRIIPVGIVDPRIAIVRAGAILASGNAPHAWMINEQRFHVRTEQGGWPARGAFNPANPQQAAVLENTEAFFAAEGGNVATPTFFYHGQTHVGSMTPNAWHRFVSTPAN